MKIRPILFSTPMVQAILDKRKTQTRRIIKPQPIVSDGEYSFQLKKGVELTGSVVEINSSHLGLISFGKYQIGDIIWVRETWQYSDDLEHPYLYKQKELEEWLPEFFKRMTWRPSIFMPKEVCRIFLECTNVRVERLNDISEKDAIAEGVEKHSDFGSTGYILYTEPEAAHTDIDAVWSFESLWETINGKKSWDDNPFVFVYDFKLTECPTNFLKDE